MESRSGLADDRCGAAIHFSAPRNALFWLLVPGSLGLLSVTRMFGDRESGVDEMVLVIFSVVSIALGTLVGASMYRWLTERYGWWQLQLGRAGKYFQRDSKHSSGAEPKDH